MEQSNLSNTFFDDFSPYFFSYNDTYDFLDSYNNISIISPTISDASFLTENELDKYSSMVFPILYMLICILGLAGNALVIYVLSRFSQTQDFNTHVTNIYNRNLAIADVCVLACLVIFIVTEKLSRWPFGEEMCKAFYLAVYATEFTSTMFIVIIAADRYFLICHPISSRKYRTLQLARIVSIGAGLSSTLITSPSMMYAEYLNFSQDHTLCTIVVAENGEANINIVTFHIFLVVMEFIIPLCFIVTFYFFMIKKLRSVTQQTNRPNRQSHRKATRIVLCAIAVYVFCLLPHWMAFILLFTSTTNGKLNVILIQTAFSLSYANSAINPILYVFLSNDFKKSLAKACPCVANTRLFRAEQPDVEL